MPSTFDWPALSAFFGERNEQPRVLLCSDLIVRMVNRAMVEALGYAVEEAVGRRWVELCVPVAKRDDAVAMLEAGLRGESHACVSELVLRGGTRVMGELEFARLGAAEVVALAITVRQLADLSPSASGSGLDFEYDISTSSGGFGDLLRMAFIGSAAPASLPRGKCFEVLHERSTACPDCPALPGAPATNGNGSHHAVRRRTAPPVGFETVTARELDGSSARLRVRMLADSLLATVNATKLSDLIDKTRLTDREAEVLRALLEGGSLHQIGAGLGLSIRTVKFHQANVLAKVGAYSRADLVRFVRF